MLHRRFSDVFARPRLAGESNAKHPQVLVLAHELFDALPVHQFQYRAANKTWAERLVDVAPAQLSGDAAGTVGINQRSGLRLVLAPSATPTYAACSKLLAAVKKPTDGDVLEFSPASSALAYEIGSAIGHYGGGVALFHP